MVGESRCRNDRTNDPIGVWWGRLFFFFTFIVRSQLLPWHFLNLRPLPHEHGSLRPGDASAARNGGCVSASSAGIGSTYVRCHMGLLPGAPSYVFRRILSPSRRPSGRTQVANSVTRPSASVSAGSSPLSQDRTSRNPLTECQRTLHRTSGPLTPSTLNAARPSRRAAVKHWRMSVMRRSCTRAPTLPYGSGGVNAVALRGLFWLPKREGQRGDESVAARP